MTPLKQTHNTGRIIEIPWERADEAADVLAHAFLEDPIARYFFPDPESHRLERLRDLFGFSCHARLARQEPLLGVECEERLVGIACVGSPDERLWTPELDRAWEDCKARLEQAVAERMERYGELHDVHRPSRSHFYLIAIGVRPEEQGKGYGRLLLDTLIQMSETHPEAAGIGLDTEKAVNVPLYERFGFRVTSQASLDGVPVWFMFRANTKTNEEITS